MESVESTNARLFGWTPSFDPTPFGVRLRALEIFGDLTLLLCGEPELLKNITVLQFPFFL